MSITCALLGWHTAGCRGRRDHEPAGAGSRRSTGPTPPPWLTAALVVLLVVILVALAACTDGAHPVASSTSSTTEPVDAPPGPLAGGTFGESATWNRPVSELGVHPMSAEFSRRMFEHGNMAGRGKIATYFAEWAYTVQDTRSARGTARVFHVLNGCCHGNIPDGTALPWSPDWRPAEDNDRIMILVDPTTGREIDLWMVQQPGANQTECLFRLPDPKVGGLAFTPGVDLCVGQADVVNGPDGQPADYRSSVSTFPVGGAWMQSLIGLVTADEVKAGRISHALNMIISPTMFGPQCGGGASDPGFGTSCGSWVSPASRLEWKNAAQPCGVNTVTDRSETVPEGARFFITLDDARIARWLDSRGYTGALRNTARIFAVALRDFGAIVENTSCYEAGVFTDGIATPDGRARWAGLGITGANTGLLDGLITSADDLRMAGVPPPVAVGRQ